MRNRLLTLAGALALIAVLGKFYAKPVFAQVRAALIQNVDEPGRTPYQEEVQTSIDPSCPKDFCAGIFNFAQVPANKRLVIKQVSAGFATVTGAVPGVGLFGGATDVIGTPEPFKFSEMIMPIGRQPGLFVFGAFCSPAKPCDQFAVNQPTNYYVEPGAAPGVSIAVDASHIVPLFMQVTLTGYYVSLP